MPIPKPFSPSIPPPSFTPSCLLDLSTKVYILSLPHPLSPTYLALLTTLYTFHATIYLGSSSPSSYTSTAILLQKNCPASKGILKPFIYNATDPSSVKAAAETLLEDGDAWRLDVLFLDVTSGEDAGGRPLRDLILYSFQLATLVLPRMHSTASHSCHFNPSIRVVWVSNSSDSDGIASTARVYHLAKEFQRRGREPLQEVDVPAYAHTLPDSNPAGVQHVVVDMALPDEQRAQRFLRALTLGAGMGTDPERGMCTLLYAGLAPDVRSGDYIVQWGRKGVVPDSFMASEVDGEGLWKWCKAHTTRS